MFWWFEMAKIAKAFLEFDQQGMAHKEIQLKAWYDKQSIKQAVTHWEIGQIV